jgi:hypothetical protein
MMVELLPEFADGAMRLDDTTKKRPPTFENALAPRRSPRRAGTDSRRSCRDGDG